MANKEIVNDVVDKLHYFTKLYELDFLFIAGDFCLGRYFDTLEGVEKIEVVSAYDNQHVNLGNIFATEILHTLPTLTEDKKILKIYYESNGIGINIEFQDKSPESYMNNQAVLNWMKQVGIEDVPLMHNIYGRDFTMNSLVYSLVNQKLLDPSNRAKEDLESNKIVSLLPPDILVKYKPISILKVIQYILTYEFRSDVSLKQAIINNVNLLQETVSTERLLKEFIKIIKINNSDKLDVLKEYKLDKLLLHPSLIEYLNKEEK